MGCYGCKFRHLETNTCRRYPMIRSYQSCPQPGSFWEAWVFPPAREQCGEYVSDIEQEKADG